MSKSDLKIIKDYLLWLKKMSIDVKAGYVFGSRVKGSARKDSDLDICIVSNSFKNDRHAARVKLMNIGMKVSDLIEPHPMTQVDFENKYNPLAIEIKKTGIKVA